MPDAARAEADGAARRGAGPLWSTGPVAWEGVTVGTVARAEVVATVEGNGNAAAARDRPTVAPLQRVAARRAAARDTQEVPTALPAAILARLELAPAGGHGG